MISLTKRQSLLLQFIVSENSQGRGLPTYPAMSRALGCSSRSGSSGALEGLQNRMTLEEIIALVPRAPDGAPLRFIPVPDLP